MTRSKFTKAPIAFVPKQVEDSASLLPTVIQSRPFGRTDLILVLVLLSRYSGSQRNYDAS